LNWWSQDYPDPQDCLFLLLHSGVGDNLGDWRNTTFDRLVDRADALSNRKEREKLYIEAQHIALSQGALIMLMQTKGMALIKPYVHGLVGTEAYDYLVPKDDNWAEVSISKH
jgi:ABC-type oligopeptide transport system substrate-binding subunit